MTRFPEALLHPEVIGPLIVTPALFMTILASIAVVLWFRSRSERARHAMLQVLIDKGQPIPPDLFAARKRPVNDLRRGVTLIAVGAGVGLAMLLAGQAASAGFALIPLLMGVGYLVVWRIETKSRAASEDRPVG